LLGQGIGRAGVRWLVDELAQRGVRTVQAFVHPRNLRSLRVLASVGCREIPAEQLPGTPDGDRLFELTLDDR
jgi:L-amino acid N-acyltransferase YncA